MAIACQVGVTNLMPQEYIDRINAAKSPEERAKVVSDIRAEIQEKHAAAQEKQSRLAALETVKPASVSFDLDLKELLDPNFLDQDLEAEGERKTEKKPVEVLVTQVQEAAKELRTIQPEADTAIKVNDKSSKKDISLGDALELFQKHVDEHNNLKQKRRSAQNAQAIKDHVQRVIRPLHKSILAAIRNAHIAADNQVIRVTEKWEQLKDAGRTDNTAVRLMMNIIQQVSTLVPALGTNHSWNVFVEERGKVLDQLYKDLDSPEFKNNGGIIVGNASARALQLFAKYSSGKGTEALLQSRSAMQESKGAVVPALTVSTDFMAPGAHAADIFLPNKPKPRSLLGAIPHFIGAWLNDNLRGKIGAYGKEKLGRKERLVSKEYDEGSFSQLRSYISWFEQRLHKNMSGVDDIGEVAATRRLIGNPLYYLMDHTGTLASNVSTAMALEGYNWFYANARSSLYQSPQDIERFAGRDDLPAKYLEVIRDAGLSYPDQAKAIGERVLSHLNLALSPLVDGSVMDRMTQAIGMEVLNNMRRMGMVQFTAINRSYLENLLSSKKKGKAKTADEELSEVSEAEIAEANKGPKAIFVRAVRGTGEDVVVGLPKEFSELVDLFGRFVQTGTFEALFAGENISRGAMPEPKKSMPTRVKRGVMDIPSHVREAYETIQKMEWKVATEATALNKLSDKVLERIAGWVDPETQHVGLREEVQARNEGIERDRLFLRMHMAAYTDKPFFFKYFLASNLRIMLDSNTVNPQNSKMHRFAVVPADSFITFNPQEVTAEELQAFQITIAAAFGHELDKLHTEPAIAKLEADLKKSSIRAAIDLLKQDSLTADEQEVIAAAAKNTHMLLAMQAQANYEKARDSGATTFTFSQPYEVDGKTNGLAISLLMFPFLDTLLDPGATGQLDTDLLQMLAATGIWGGDEEAETFADLIGEKPDNYQKFIFKVQDARKELPDKIKSAEAFLVQLLDDIDETSSFFISKAIWRLRNLKQAAYRLDKLLSMLSRNESGEFTKDGKVSKDWRDVAKVFMIPGMYGAGGAASTAGFLKNPASFYQQFLTSIHHDQEMGLEEKVTRVAQYIQWMQEALTALPKQKLINHPGLGEKQNWLTVKGMKLHWPENLDEIKKIIERQLAANTNAFLSLGMFNPENPIAENQKLIRTAVEVLGERFTAGFGYLAEEALANTVGRNRELKNSVYGVTQIMGQMAYLMYKVEYKKFKETKNNNRELNREQIEQLRRDLAVAGKGLTLPTYDFEGKELPPEQWHDMLKYKAEFDESLDPATVFFAEPNTVYAASYDSQGNEEQVDAQYTQQSQIARLQPDTDVGVRVPVNATHGADGQVATRILYQAAKKLNVSVAQVFDAFIIPANKVREVTLEAQRTFLSVMQQKPIIERVAQSYNKLLGHVEAAIANGDLPASTFQAIAYINAMRHADVPPTIEQFYDNQASFTNIVSKMSREQLQEGFYDIVVSMRGSQLHVHEARSQLSDHLTHIEQFANSTATYLLEDDGAKLAEYKPTQVVIPDLLGQSIEPVPETESDIELPIPAKTTAPAPAAKVTPATAATTPAPTPKSEAKAETKLPMPDTRAAATSESVVTPPDNTTPTDPPAEVPHPSITDPDARALISIARGTNDGVTIVKNYLTPERFVRAYARTRTGIVRDPEKARLALLKLLEDTDKKHAIDIRLVATEPVDTAITWFDSPTNTIRINLPVDNHLMENFIHEVVHAALMEEAVINPPKTLDESAFYLTEMWSFLRDELAEGSPEYKAAEFVLGKTRDLLLNPNNPAEMGVGYAATELLAYASTNPAIAEKFGKLRGLHFARQEALKELSRDNAPNSDRQLAYQTLVNFGSSPRSTPALTQIASDAETSVIDSNSVAMVVEEMGNRERNTDILSEAHKDYLNQLTQRLLVPGLASIDDLIQHIKTSPEGKNLGLLQGNDVYIDASDGTNTPDMSLMETAVHEYVHAIMANAIETDYWVREELSDMFQAASQQLTYRDLLKNPEEASPEEEAMAKERFDYIFNNPDVNKGLHEFATFGLTNEAMRTALANVKNPTSRQKKAVKQAAKGGILGRLAALFNYVMDQLIGKVFTSQKKTVDKALLKLADNVVKINKQNGHRQFKQGQVDKAIENADQWIIKSFSKKVYRPVREYVQNQAAKQKKSGEFEKITTKHKLFGVLDLPFGIREATQAKRVKDSAHSQLFHDVLKQHKVNHRNPVLYLLREVFEAPERNKNIQDILRKVKALIDNGRKETESHTASYLENGFHKKTEISRKDWERLTDALLRTDTGLLLKEGYTPAQIQSFLADPAALQAEIDKRNAELDKLGGKARHYMKQHAHNLGLFMATGRVFEELGNPMLNATNIVNQHGLLKKHRTAIPNQAQAVSAVGSLASLYAIQYTHPKAKKEVSRIWQEEAARTDLKPGYQNGIERMISLQQTLTADAREANFDGKDVGMAQGYIHESFSSNIQVEYVADTSENRKQMKRKGFKLAEALPRDPTIPHQPPMLMYISNYSIPEWQGGAVSLGDKEQKGTDLLEIAASSLSKKDGLDVLAHRTGNLMKEAVTNNFNKASAALQPLPKLTASYGRAVIPVISPRDGRITSYRYVMSHANKVKYLGRQDYAQHALGRMAALIPEKQNREELNRSLVDTLKADWDGRKDKEYKGSSDTYFYIGPNARNREQRDMWDSLPHDMKKYIEKTFGKEELPVRGSVYYTVFGFRKKSFEHISEYNKGQAWDMVRNLYNDHPMIRQSIGVASNLLKEIVSIAYGKMVILLPDVVLGNSISNVILLRVQGIPFDYIAREGRKALVAYHQYQEDREALNNLQFQVSAEASTRDVSRDLQKIQLLSDKLARNPIRLLIEEGLTGNIVDKYSMLQETKDKEYIAKGLNMAVEATHNKQMEKIIPEVLVSKGSDTFNAAMKVTQYSDFIARAVQMKFDMEVRKKPQKEAARDAMDNFIHYDLPQQPWLQAANDYGFAPFTKFYLRIQKVAWNLFQKHPIASTAALTADGMVTYQGFDTVHSYLGNLNKLGNKVDFDPTRHVDDAMGLVWLKWFDWINPFS